MVNNTVKITVGVGALIYSQSTKRYLFLLRNGAKHGGEWGLVGGKIDAGEIPIQALKREISEEIGTVTYEKIIPLELFTSDNARFEYHTYIIPVDEEFIPTLNHEHRGYAWTHIEDHPRPLHPGVWRSFNFDSVLKKIRTVEHIL
jgi:8-oxo-dGTP pyrophosphatase MutT (NUDIX family)